MMANVLCSHNIYKLVDKMIIAFTAAITYFIGKIYILIWDRTKGLSTVPSGFGMLLPLFLLTVMLITQTGWVASLISILIISIAGLIYWFDDIVHLPPWTRILIAFASGILLFLTASLDIFFTPFELVSLSIMCGIFSIGLTNVINFYDGSDLNLGTLGFLTGTFIIFFSDTPTVEFENIGLIEFHSLYIWETRALLSWLCYSHSF